MKTIIIFLTLLFSTTTMAVDIDNSTGLYTKEELSPLNMEQMSEILDRFHNETPEKNIVFYIHGRARYTKEEWESLPQLEKNYGVRVVMFRWPAWKSLMSRPVNRAKESADELAKALKEIRLYKDNHPEMFVNKKISLLTHSMGHIVLREFVEKHYANDLNNPGGEPLFDNYVSAGADVGLSDHREWLASIDFANRKYVTMNNRDLMLLLSYLLDLKAKKPYFYKLGLGFDNFKVKKDKISKMIDNGTTYIDLSRSLNVDHRYFQSQKPLMLKMFKSMVNGENFKPETLGVKIKKEHGINYVID